MFKGRFIVSLFLRELIEDVKDFEVAGESTVMNLFLYTG